MPDRIVAPSTVVGIKRRAKALARSLGVQHSLALDLAAKQCGYQNFRHARRTLAATTLTATGLTHELFLTAFWRQRGAAGRETLQISLPKKLADALSRYQLSRDRTLGSFKLEAPDHLLRRVDLDDQESAKRELSKAAETVRFLSAIGLRPVTTARERSFMRRFQGLPHRDHEQLFLDVQTGDWVYMDEPYPRSIGSARDAWVGEQRIQMIVPEWLGLHAPGHAKPHLFCESAELAASLGNRFDDLAALSSKEDEKWHPGLYGTLFVSPLRKALGTNPRPRPKPAFRDVERGGALPYGPGRGGEASLWRPARRMALSTHLRVGPLLHALGNSSLPSVAARIIDRVRSTLDDWLMIEYPGDEMTQEQFHAAYYGEHRRPILERSAQVSAIQEVDALLVQGYADCSPIRKMRQDLSRATAKIAGM